MSESLHTEVVDGGQTERGRGLAGSGPLASFARFVVCGGGVSVLASAVVPSVAQVMPWTLANALITVVSTLLCTELHALITFRTGRPAGLRRHLQSAGSATASYAVTTIAVLVLHAVQPSAGRLLEQAVYLGAAGLAGIGRFLVLRLFVFAARSDRTGAQGADQETGNLAAEANSQSLGGSREQLAVVGAATGPRPVLVHGRSHTAGSVRARRGPRRRPAPAPRPRRQTTRGREWTRRSVPAAVRRTPEPLLGGLGGLGGTAAPAAAHRRPSGTTVPRRATSGPGVQGNRKTRNRKPQGSR